MSESAHPSSRRRSRAWGGAILSFLVLASIAGHPVPVVAEQEPEIEGTKVPVLKPPLPPPAPLAAADRIPVPVDSEVGITDPRSTLPVDPAESRPLDEMDGLHVRPRLGGPNYDVFATEEGGIHAALVYGEDVNVRTSEGRWVKAPPRLEEAPDGWRGQFSTGSVSFPHFLGEGPGVLFAVGEHRVSTSLEGAAALRGRLDEGGRLEYRGVLPSTDARYTVGSHGFKEELVLRDPEAPGSFSYLIDAGDLELTPGEGGQFVFRDGEEIVAVIPTPVAYDSSSSMADAVAATTLTPLGKGKYRLGVRLDEEYLRRATYPVRLDPGQATAYPTRDTWANQASPNTNYDGGDTLKVGSGKRSFIRFDLSGLRRDERLVYGALLKVRVQAQDAPSEPARVRRITESWPQNLTWNNQPAIDSTSHGNGTGPTGDWLEIEAKSLYQLYVDNTETNRGNRLHSTDEKTFRAEEYGAGNFGPRLELVWNDLPSAPDLQSPGQDAEVFTDAPVLSATATDLNGDDVVYRYQVSTSAQSFSGSNLVWSSGWVEEGEVVTVPPGLLETGTYWWRAQARDLCEPPDGLCSLVDGSGTTRPVPTSSARKLTVTLQHLGEDDRAAIWSQNLGNDMSLKVNQATGNLLLHVPLDSLATPAADLDLSLHYNHHQDGDIGLGPGWDVFAGPESFGGLAPVGLTEVSAPGISPGEMLEVRSRTGAVTTFTKRSAGLFRSSGPDEGVIHQGGDGSYLLTTEQGDAYAFDPEGALKEASPATTVPGEGGFRYIFDGGGNVTSVEDAIGRTVDFSWDQGQLQGVTTWDERSWQLSYQGGRLASLTNPAGETVSFSYDQAGRLSQIRDGQQTEDDIPGWAISYQAATGDPLELPRASELHPPAPLGASWEIEYEGPFHGSVASQARLTDPRGVASPTADDYQTRTDFSKFGLPIRVAGPADQHGYWPITTRVWDSRGNLLCERSPEANAVEEHCTATLGTADPLSTEYVYDEDQLIEIRQPAPNPDGSGPRAVESFAYDEGPGFEGLWREAFDNAELAGLPIAQGVSGDFDQDWGSGSPPEIGQGDDWGLRWTGLLVVEETQKRDYEFRIASDFDHAGDRVRIAVGNATLIDCYGTAPSGTNCPPKAQRRALDPGAYPVTFEFSEGGGLASLRLEWRKKVGNWQAWQVMQASDLEPDLGLVTTTITPGLI